MPNLYYSDAVKAFYDREYARAQDLFLKAIIDDTDHAVCYFFLGKISFLSNEKKGAITYLEQYIELSRHDARERSNVAHAFDVLGQCYDADNMDDKALDCYLEAIKLDSSCASPWHNRGLFFMKLAKNYLEKPFEERYESLRYAYGFLKKALLLSPQNPIFFHSVASWHEQSIENMEQSAESVLDFQQKRDSHFKLAISYYQKALATCDKDDTAFMRIVTDNLSECLAQYGHIHYRNEDYAAAEGCYLQTVQLDSAHLVALNQLGMCYVKQGNFSHARTYFQAILSKTDDSQELADAWLNIACTYRLEKSFKKAEDALNQAKILSDDVPALSEEEKKLVEAKVLALLTTTSQTWFGARQPSLRASLPQAFLIEHRHEDPTLQHEYDTQFGLTLTT